MSATTLSVRYTIFNVYNIEVVKYILINTVCILQMKTLSTCLS